jgi:hypothetical protein
MALLEQLQLFTETISVDYKSDSNYTIMKTKYKNKKGVIKIAAPFF